jgi:1-acyl-sn-glycerol-3-phosphate acyltransferase
MMKASHHIVIYNFFKIYTRWKIRRSFHTVEVNRTFTDKDLPVLLIMNHMSWWDGFWALYLNMKLFHRKFHFMMLESQLRRYPFFNKCGGYSVNKHTRSIIETLDYTVELLSENKNLVLLFPQGEIESLYTHSLHFEPGIEYILKKLNRKIQVVFVANLVDYFSNPRPTLYVYLKEYTSDSMSVEDIQSDYNAFYSQCIMENLKKANG